MLEMPILVYRVRNKNETFSKMNFFLVHLENGINHSNFVNTKHLIHHLRIVGNKYFEPDPKNQASVSPQGQGGTCFWGLKLPYGYLWVGAQ
jgi:hypothetical protein